MGVSEDSHQGDDLDLGDSGDVALSPASIVRQLTPQQIQQILAYQQQQQLLQQQEKQAQRKTSKVKVRQAMKAGSMQPGPSRQPQGESNTFSQH